MNFKNTTELNAITDDLNRVIVEFEAFLKQKSFGVTAVIEVRVPDSEEVFFLGYGKMGDNWRLLYLKDPEGSEVCLGSVSRKYRVLATDAFPELYEALLDENDSQVETIQIVIDKARTFMKEHS